MLSQLFFGSWLSDIVTKRFHVDISNEKLSKMGHGDKCII